MAVNNVSIYETENKILVTNIPKRITRNNLEIHFQKSRFGGGDIASVVYPKSTEELGCAVVEFEDRSTVQSVLQNNHFVGKQRNHVLVSKFNREVFQSATFELAKQVSSGLDGNYEECLNELGLNTQTKNGALIVSGEWYKVKAAFERLEQLNSKETDDTHQSQSNGDASVDVTNMLAINNVSTPMVNRKKPFSDTISVDADTFELLKHQSDAELKQILEKHGVTITQNKKKDKMDVTFISEAGDQEFVDVAINSFQELFQTTQENLKQINYALSKHNDVRLGKIVQAIRRASAAYPEVVLTTETEKGCLSVFSSSNELCQAAIDVFCCIIGNNAPRIERDKEQWSSLNMRPEIPRPLFLFTYPITGIVISVVCDDISKQKTEAIVNAANAELVGGAGVTGAIYKAGGWEFEEECRLLMKKRSYVPLRIGEVVHTKAYKNLQCRTVIHVTGPTWDSFSGRHDKKVNNCLSKMKQLCSNLLSVASTDVKARSVAIPAIGTGIYGVPLEIFCDAMAYAIETYNRPFRVQNKPVALKEIRLVNYNRNEAKEIAKYFQNWKPNSTPV